MKTKVDYRGVFPDLVVAALILTAIAGVSVVAPTEATMGAAQRILYVHVAVAWLGLVGFIVMAAAGLAYLVKRDLGWDDWSRAAAELGWLFAGLTLATGSLWGHAAWNTWWTWEPRLTTSFLLWCIYSGILVARASLDEAHHQARMAAVLAVVGLLDIPLVVMATRWFRGIHPVSPAMAPTMRIVLLLAVVGFSALFVVLLVRRRAQLHLERLLNDLQQGFPL